MNTERAIPKSPRTEHKFATAGHGDVILALGRLRKEFKVSLGCTGSTRPAAGTQQDPVSKQQKTPDNSKKQTTKPQNNNNINKPGCNSSYNMFLCLHS